MQKLYILSQPRIWRTFIPQKEKGEGVSQTLRDMPGCDERKHVYVTVDDVRECGAMGEVQVAARRKMVSTDQSLIMMDADETDACRKLRDLHLMDGVMTSRVVFKDIFGCRFK
tara:strand:+ start:175 stop:513 length:339 start_codon:yes stop_codon:yes gene_type:complete